MFKFEENGTELIFLTTNETISSYLVNFNTLSVSHSELKKWGKALETNLTTDKRELKAFCEQEAIDELARDEYLFSITEESSFLHPSIELSDLNEEILSQIPEDLLKDIKKLAHTIQDARGDEDYDSEENEF